VNCRWAVRFGRLSSAVEDTPDPSGGGTLSYTLSF
jgi:hypothetical protein